MAMMKSMHFWSEPVLDPVLGGKWTLVIQNVGDKPFTLNHWDLVFYGFDCDDSNNENFRDIFKKRTELLI